MRYRLRLWRRHDLHSEQGGDSVIAAGVIAAGADRAAIAAEVTSAEVNSRRNSSASGALRA